MVLNFSSFSEGLAALSAFDAKAEREARKKEKSNFYQMMIGEGSVVLKKFSTMDFINMMKKSHGILDGYDVESGIRRDIIERSGSSVVRRLGVYRLL